MKPNNVSEIVPKDRQYMFDESTSLATVEIDVHGTGEPVQYGTVTAKLTIGEYGDEDSPEYAIDAEYVSHEGNCSKAQIEHALRVIETNDFGV